MQPLDISQGFTEYTPGLSEEFDNVQHEALRLVTFLNVYVLRVVGVPAGQGSKRAYVVPGTNRAAIKEQATPKGIEWRDAVANEAHRQSRQGLVIDVRVIVDVVYLMPMPKSRPKWMRTQGMWPSTQSPDLDKLDRSLLDGLSAGGVLTNDKLYCSGQRIRVETTGWTGALIRLCW